MKNKYEDLKNHLFATLEGLLDEESPMDIERASAVAKVGQVIVNAAKLEIEARKLAKDSSVNIPLPTFYTEENKNQLNQSDP